MFTYKSFVEVLKEEMENMRPELVVEHRVIKQLDQEVDALIYIMDDGKPSPCIYPAILYDGYVDGMPFYSVLSYLTKMVFAAPPDMDVDPFVYDDVKDRLFMKVTHVDRCEEVLDNIPHRLIEDLVITYHVYIGSDGSEEGFYATIINDEMLKKYGITEDRLHEDAAKNAAEMFPSQLTSMDAIPFDIYCLTNRRGRAGSSALFYPDEMKRLAKRFKNRKLTILPASVEEVVIIPGSELDTKTIRGLARMLYETFKVDNEELSDGIYTYSPRTDAFERIGNALELQ